MFSSSRVSTSAKTSATRKLLPLLFVLAAVQPALALDGSVYFRRLFGSTLADGPQRISVARFVSGVEVRERFWRLEPYVNIETRMDEMYRDATFHPTSVRYTVGGKLLVAPRLSVTLERMCWHPVDTNGPVEQYWGVEVRWSWR